MSLALVRLKMAIPRVLCRVRLLQSNDFLAVLKCSTFITSISLNKNILQFQRSFRSNFSANIVSELSQKIEDKANYLASPSKSSSSSSSSSSDSDSDEDEVKIEYFRGLPQITVPLPSRKEFCKFTLKPISNTVGDFLDMLCKEDKGIDRALCKTMDGIRIASSTSIETLLQENFKLIINDYSYNVHSPIEERLTAEEIERVSDVKNLVSQLYEALHIKEHQIQKELEITTQLETLQQELQPLEEKKLELELVATKKSNWLAWAGLGLMSIQFGILARLTWWEYSWDIMEPVTYFVTYGTGMAAYAYFVLTRQEYMLNDVRNRQQLVLMHKKAKKTGFNLNQYNLIKDEITKLELDLKRLRDPLKLRVPPKPKVTTISQSPETITTIAETVVPVPDNTKEKTKNEECLTSKDAQK